MVTADELKRRMGVTSMRAVFWRLALMMGKRIVDEVAERPVKAFWDHGRWVGLCECGGAEVVDPEEPIFFCCSCGNEQVEGRWRTVEFPGGGA